MSQFGRGGGQSCYQLRICSWRTGLVIEGVSRESEQIMPRRARERSGESRLWGGALPSTALANLLGCQAGLLGDPGRPLRQRAGETLHIGKIFGGAYYVECAERLPHVIGARFEQGDLLVRLDRRALHGCLYLNLSGKRRPDLQGRLARSLQARHQRAPIGCISYRQAVA